VRFFHRLGLTASGFEESRDSARAARQLAPGLEFLTGSLSAFPLDEPEFDLVAATDLEAHARSLFAREALHATASLLSCVRPGGSAVLLVRFAEDGHAAGGHTASCFVRHLSHFSGQLEIGDFPEGVAGVDPLGWIVGRRPRPGFLLAGLRVSAEAPSQLGWHDQAEAAASARRDDCCRPGPAAGRRSAA
jgi:SAM-dependent methyltransferase